MPAPLPPEKKALFLRFITEGFPVKTAADRSGVSYSFAKKYLSSLDSDNGDGWRALRENAKLDGPIPLDKLKPEALRALNDIAHFALRYFGAIVLPWQIEATVKIVALLESEDEEKAVVNCPPGAGKSTFFSLILPCWLTVKNRSIRGMVVSNTQRNAENYLVNIRRMLTEPIPIKASPLDLKLGIAVDAQASIVNDYGLFKSPGDGEKWTAQAFQVMQHKGQPVSEKENTWQAFGRGGAFLGNRLEFIVCDDVYDASMVRTSEAKEEFRRWWDKHVESRLEPTGVLLLVGQRQDPEDVSRYCLDKKSVEYDDNGDEVEGSEGKLYHHIKFKAHYDELCKGEHRNAKPWPEGCLLYPKRIRWQKLANLKANSPEVYAVEYQQEDIAPGTVLVDPLWVAGGVDPRTGIEYPGCWDKDRGAWELPRGLAGDVFVYATCDPSPKNYWSIQLWAYHPSTEQRFLLQHFRAKMDAPGLLDFNLSDQRYTGVMEEWQVRSVKLGIPIRYWIVEDNAAQRFLLQYDYALKWRTLRSVEIVRMNTNGANKADPVLGVTTLAPHYKFGRIRLPGKQLDPEAGRLNALKLVKEVTLWPQGRTDDAVMAQWFGEWNLPRLYSPPVVEAPRFNRPSWVSERPLLRRVA
jgi:hypothetical protein